MIELQHRGFVSKFRFSFQCASLNVGEAVEVEEGEVEVEELDLVEAVQEAAEVVAVDMIGVLDHSGPLHLVTTADVWPKE